MINTSLEQDLTVNKTKLIGGFGMVDCAFILAGGILAGIGYSFTHNKYVVCLLFCGVCALNWCEMYNMKLYKFIRFFINDLLSEKTVYKTTTDLFSEKNIDKYSGKEKTDNKDSEKMEEISSEKGIEKIDTKKSKELLMAIKQMKKDRYV